jgi:hypothetical protein
MIGYDKIMKASVQAEDIVTMPKCDNQCGTNRPERFDGLRDAQLIDLITTSPLQKYANTGTLIHYPVRHESVNCGSDSKRAICDPAFDYGRR